MFTPFALVCGLVGADIDYDYDDCKLLGNQLVFETELQCMEYIHTDGLVGLSLMLFENGQLDATVEEAYCEPMGEPT